MKVSIVKLSALGDVIHALPLARAIRRAHPLAQITWIVERRESAILRGHPDLDRVIPVDTRRWRRLLRHPEGAREVWGKLGGLRGLYQLNTLLFGLGVLVLPDIVSVGFYNDALDADGKLKNDPDKNAVAAMAARLVAVGKAVKA